MLLNSKLILSIPHASTVIPEDEIHYYDRLKLTNEIRLMTDHFTDDLFSLPFLTLRFPVSRLVCDPERFRKDEDEPMSKVGMGAVYTSCSDLSKLRDVSQSHRDYLLRTYYDPFHELLSEIVEKTTAKHDGCLIIDCHSFSPTPLPYEPNQSPLRPDICIGVDDFHTPPTVQDLLIDQFNQKGYTVAVNDPYSGSIVPLKYYTKDPRIKSVMIEINRRLYIDNNIHRTTGYEKLKKDVREVIMRVNEITELF